MKHEKGLTVFAAAELAFILSFGAVGAMVTGLDLNVTGMWPLALICGFFALFTALCCLRKWGGMVLFCLVALLAVRLWRQGEAAEQFLQLIYRITTLYDMAYGWGALALTDGAWNDGSADLPMAIIGSAIAILTARTICKQKPAFPAAGAALLPLLSCLVVTDTVPDTPYLFLLMTGLVLLFLTNSVRRESAAQGNRLTALTAIPVTLAMAGLFLAVPREGYVNRAAEFRETVLAWVQDFPATAESTVQSAAQVFSSGEPETVDLKALGQRIPQTYPVMEVTASESGTLYLRGQDYDVYSGTGWSASPHRAETFTCPSGAAGEVTIQTRARKDIFYTPYYPAEETHLTAGKLSNTEGLREYTVSCRALPDNWHDIATAPPVYDHRIDFTDGIYSEDWDRYLTLPNAARTTAEALVRNLLQDLDTTTEQAEAIAQYVKNSAEYDLNTGKMPEEAEDFALWFLENSDTGYCVHFATAAVVLLRAADIPARYVSGYMVEAQAGTAVTVTPENAHAWAEYYESRLDAWIVLEATPAAPAEEETASQPSTIPAATEADAPTAPTERETSAPQETEAQQSAAPRPHLDLRPLAALAKWLFALATAVLALTGQRSLRLALRKKKQYSGDPNAQALARWREAELLARLLKQSPPEELLALAQKAKFSQHTLTPEELQSFDDHRRACRRALRRQPWYKRLVHTYVFAAY